MAENVTEVCSLVFFDLEATGLAEKGEKPRITELSLVAVHRSSFNSQCKQHTPRVLNKLTVCVDPEKPISFQACGMTGLYNDALSLHPPFNENVADLMEAFFKQLPRPICVLAHNGSRYDFPLLAAELHRVGRKLPEGILCADTMDGFRDILSKEQVKEFVAKTLKSSATSNRNQNPKPGSSGTSGRKSIRRNIRMNMVKNREMETSDTTPEMQTVKVSGFSNAPKKKPITEDLPKEERVSAARRKLDFGASPPPADKAIDDVDVEDVLVTLSGGFRVTRNPPTDSQETQDSPNSVPFTTSTGGFKVTSPAPMDSQETLEYDPMLVDSVQEDEDVPDEELLHAVEEMEKTVLPPLMDQEPIPSTSSAGDPPMKTWAQILKKESKEGNGKMKTVTNHNLAEAPSTSQIKAVPHTPTGSEKEEVHLKKTPTSVPKPFIDSFPTPSPSPHKVPAEEEDAWPMLPSPSTSACPSPNPCTGTGNNKTTNQVGFSLALPSIHRHVVGFNPYNAHSAEDDCMSLLRIAQKLAPWFCSWVDTHVFEFSSVTPLYTSNKRPKKK